MADIISFLVLTLDTTANHFFLVAVDALVSSLDNTNTNSFLISEKLISFILLINGSTEDAILFSDRVTSKFLFLATGGLFSYISRCDGECWYELR